MENVKLLQDPKSDVQIAFVTGGVSDAKHAPGDSFVRNRLQPTIIGYFIPLLSRLIACRSSKAKRIAVGPEGSGTRLSAEQILGKGGVNSETAMLLPFAGSAAVKALSDKKVDAVWIIGSPDATAVKSFLGNPDVRLLGFPMAEAFTRIFPELVRLVLPKGVVDIDRNIPADDVQLIGTTCKILVRSDLHPEIVQLLLQTMTETHGGSGYFSPQRRISQRHRHRVSGCPYGYRLLQKRSFVSAEASAFVAIRSCAKSDRGVVTGIAIGLPLFRFLPQLYNWITRRRLFHWYGQLKALDASFDTSPDDKHLREKQTR